MKGRLENFLSYIFEEEGSIAGTLDLNSNLLDLNELMSGSEEEVVEETGDSVVMSVIGVPANIDFVFRSSLKKVKYDSLNIDNLYGTIIVRDQRVILKNLNIDILQGSVALNGEYNTKDIKSPFIDLSLDVRKIDIPEAFKSFVAHRIPQA